MTNEELLLNTLINAAYETGYYSGKREDGQLHHVEAIARRTNLKQQVLARMQSDAPVYTGADELTDLGISYRDLDQMLQYEQAHRQPGYAGQSQVREYEWEDWYV